MNKLEKVLSHAVSIKVVIVSTLTAQRPVLFTFLFWLNLGEMTFLITASG